MEKLSLSKKRELESSSKPQDPFYTSYTCIAFKNVHLETPDFTLNFEKVGSYMGHTDLGALACVLSWIDLSEMSLACLLPDWCLSF